MDAAHAESTYPQYTNKNILFKYTRAARGCLLSPTHSNSEDKVRVFATIKYGLTPDIIFNVTLTAVKVKSR